MRSSRWALSGLCSTSRRLSRGRMLRPHHDLHAEQKMTDRQHFNLIVRDATVIDGSRAPRYRADIGVLNDRIAAMGRLDDSSADIEIDASRLVAAPGFIDAHTHDDRLLLSD